MKKKADEYLYNEALKYLGKYPATKKKISEILEKRLKNKKTYQKVIFLENISKKVSENPDLELDILKRFILKKKLSKLETSELKKKLYQQSFSENSIYKVIRD